MAPSLQEAGLNVLRKGNEAYKRRRNPPLVQRIKRIWSCCLPLGTHKCQMAIMTAGQIEKLLEYPFTDCRFKAHLDCESDLVSSDPIHVCRQDILAHIGNIIPDECLNSFLEALNRGEIEIVHDRAPTPSLADNYSESEASWDNTSLASGPPQRRRHFYGWAVTSAKIHYMFPNLIKANVNGRCEPLGFVENIPSKRKIPWVKFLRES